MKKKKGMSFDEKREKMLKIFHQTQSVFKYDQVEKISVKAGIPFPTVKQILKSLMADNLVQSQKIGIGVFYWSFPSRAVQIYQMKIGNSQKQIAYFQQDLKRINSELEEGQAGREQSQERQTLVQELSLLKKEQSALQKQIEKYIRFDPERIALLKKQNKELKEMINLETDNLQQIKKYIKKMQPGIKDKQIEQMYEIPADMDYLD